MEWKLKWNNKLLVVSLSIPKQKLVVPGQFQSVNESYSLCCEASLDKPTLQV
jgi:hypothetical protein